MKLEVYAGELPEEGVEFISSHRMGMVYHVPEWLRIVSSLTESQFFYLVGLDGAGGIKGLVPVCLKDGPLGTIANSSPFFGSHGGILADGEETFDALASGLLRFLMEQGAVAANIIEPLFATDGDRYQRTMPVTDVDRRIGQYKDLRGLEARDRLFGSLGGLTRSNLERRAWRSGMRIFRDESPAGLASVHAMHQEEMSRRPGGNPKPWRFFELVGQHLLERASYRVYLAEIEGEIVAGLLVIRWRDFIEYITPAFKEVARMHQPMSALIFQAMLE
ncbi:MAG: GNAT family N-acetyltransferase, partial [Candidatus Methylomirabilis sp.]